MSEQMKVKDNFMETEKIGKLILRFSIPCVIAMIVSALYNIVDQIFIGRGVGYIGNAATTVGFPIIVLTQGIALFFGDGAAAYYSLKLGEKNKRDGAKAIANMVVILAVLGILCGIILSPLLPRLLWSFGATETNFSYAFDYMRLIVITIPLAIFSVGMSSIIRADGSPEYAMISLIIGTVLNCILDPLFIFAFHMGIKGAAIATVIGEIVSFLLCINYFRKFKNIKLKKEDFKLDGKIIRTIMAFGLSSFVTQVAVTFIVIVSNNMIAKYGAQSVYGSDIPLSALGIVMKVNDILIGIVIGIAAGGQPILGYNYGAKNYARVKKAYIILVKAATVISVIAFIVFQFFPEGVVSLFGEGNDLYKEFAVKSFRLFLMLCMFIGFELTTMIFFQAIGKPVKSIILTLCKQTIFIIPLMIILPVFYGVEGVLYAGPCAEIMSVIITFILIRSEFRKIKRVSK